MLIFGNSTPRVWDMFRMNTYEFLGMHIREDLQNIIDNVNKIFLVMQLCGIDRLSWHLIILRM